MQVTRDRIADDLRRLGVRPGGVLMPHSSLRSLGTVDGGAAAVVDAMLDALGEQGTLVGPSFTFGSAQSPDFVFDPVRTPSDMGAIADEIRRRAGPARSLHATHSVSAIGAQADEILAAAGASAWDERSPLGTMFGLGGHFLLLGVTYQSFTAVHVLEIAFGARHRQTATLWRTLRGADGRERRFASTVYNRGPAYPGYDFNRLGQAMEDAGIVSTGPVGNAMARLVPARPMQAFAAAQIDVDPDYLFLQQSRETPLRAGAALDLPRGKLSVADPTAIFRPKQS